MNLTEVTRRSIIDYFLTSTIAFSGDLDELEFLERTWKLSSMPSWDGRFSNAYQDIRQHRINNFDWSDSYLLYKRLDLLQCEYEMFCNFLENCVHPIVRSNQEEVANLVSTFNEDLRKDGCILREVSQRSGRSIYKVMPLGKRVPGNVKNLIFAAYGEKPEIVLIDAVNNDIEVVRNEENCLIYDKSISDRGLLWTDLITWWCEKHSVQCSDMLAAERNLFKRLEQSLPESSPPEKLLFKTYFSYFRSKLEKNLPALIPQVYLHYDPKTIGQLAGKQRLIRQRMDFLLLFSNQARVIIEVDGKQHYAAGDVAKPELYASMVAEDRKLRLIGYEIYRFGGYELCGEQGKEIIVKFFCALFKQHGISL